MKYLVTVAGREIEVEVDGDRVTVAGVTRTATLGTVPGTPLRQLLVDGRPTVLTLGALGRGQWTLGVGGDRWEAEVVDERTRHIRSLTAGADRRARARPPCGRPCRGWWSGCWWRRARRSRRGPGSWCSRP